MLVLLRAVATNEITITKMVSNEVIPTKAEEPFQIMRKDPKKVEAGKRLAEFNCRNKEKLAQPEAKAKESKPKPSQAYGFRAVIAVVVLGLLCYYIYESKKGDNTDVKVALVRPVEVQTQKRARNFEIE